MKEQPLKRETFLLSAITVDEDLQSRVEIDHVTVDEYIAAIERGDVLPPLEGVLDDDGVFWLYDGFHRYEAYDACGIDKVAVRWRTGSKEDAAWLAIGANKTHGLKRTNADKRRAVELALAHPHAASMSDNKIAEHCGVSHTFVSVIRKERGDGFHYPPEQGESCNGCNSPPDGGGDEFDDDAPDPGFENGFSENEAEADDVDERESKDGTNAIGDFVDAPLQDEFGRTFTPHALSRMRDVPRIQTAKRRLGDLQADLNALIKDRSPILSFLEESRIRSALKNIKGILDHATPYCVCPLCEGDGCPKCRDAGWVTRELHAFFTQTQS